MKETEKWEKCTACNQQAENLHIAEEMLESQIQHVTRVSAT